MTAFRAVFSLRISACSTSIWRTSSSEYSYVVTRLSSSKSVDIRLLPRSLQQHDGRAPSPAASICILIRLHEVECREQRADSLALHAGAASMNEPHLPEAARL